MSKAKAMLLIAGLIALLSVAVYLIRFSASHAPARPRRRPPPAFVVAFQNYWRKYFPPRADVRFSLPGPPGTPVLVGCRTDGGHEKVFKAVLPTNFTFRARYRVEVAIKNLGNTIPGFGYDFQVPTGGLGSDGGSEFLPPFYGSFFDLGLPPNGSWEWNSRTLNPNDWPVALPPGVSAREAKTRDFGRERTQLELQSQLDRLAKNPNDHIAMTQVGRLNFLLKNQAAAEEVYERFFASDCKDPQFLNSAVYEYMSFSGTNFEGAYQLALRAHTLKPEEAYISDTLAWIQVKRGYYDDALRLLLSNIKLARRPEVIFHTAMAHYMLLEEGPAREGFETLARNNWQIPGFQEAKKCLAILDLKLTPPSATALSLLKARLAEAPDDPVALSRLGEISEPTATGGNILADPLIFKALGVRAYRRADYARAADYLVQSAKSRAPDGECLLYLGFARKNLQQTNECADALRTAKRLGLKAAQIEEVNAVLAALPPN